MKISRNQERGIWTVVTCTLCVALVGAVTVDDDIESLMRRKLGSAQALLAGLAKEDFEAIKSSAEELTVVSQEAQWKRLMTNDYHELSGDFRVTTEKLGEMADKRNLDGATLHYMQLVMNCVECHKVVREGAQIARAK